MQAGVSCYCFNASLVAGNMTLDELIAFVGGETEAERIELLSRYWRDDAPEAAQAVAARRRIDAAGLDVSCYTLDSDFAVYDADRNRACIAKCQ